MLSVTQLSSRLIAEVTQPLRITISPQNTLPPLVWDYNPPAVSAFSTGSNYGEVLNQAVEYENPQWRALSRTQKATYMLSIYEQLLELHQTEGDPSFRISPRILVCKTYNESSFHPQMGNHVSNAVGLSQIVPDTLEDIFSSPRLNFRSRLARHHHIQNGEDFRAAMVNDPIAQMEAGLAVLELKRRYRGLSGDSVRPILEAYYGSRDAAANTAYANAIFDCAKCAQDNGNVFTVSCLCKAKPSDTGCTNGQ